MTPRHASLSCLAAAALLAATATGALAQAGPAAPQAPTVEASDVYLQAYLFMQEAEKLEARQDYNAAYFKYHDASGLFDSVARSFPAWNPQMVDFRRRKIREKMAAMRAEHGISPGAAPAAVDPIAAPSPGAAPGTVVRAPGAGAAPAGTASAEVQQRLSQYETYIRRLTDERTQLLANLESKESVLRETRRELFKAQQAERDLRSKLLASEDELGKSGGGDEVKTLEAQVAELKTQLAAAGDAMAQANARTATLLKELEDANATIKSLRENEEKLTKERNELAAIVSGNAAGGAGDANALVVENMRLQRELEAARATIASLELGRESDRQVIADLREQVADVKAQLAQLQRENRAYRGQVAELTERLKMTSDRLTGAPALAVPEAVRENEVLKDVILRQLKAQSRREQAKRLVLDKLAELEIDSAELLAHLEEVAGPPLELDPGEESLFKDPQFDQFVGSAEVHANLITARGDRGPAASTVFAPPTAALTGELAARAAAAAREFEAGNFAESANHWHAVLDAEPQNVFAMEELGVVNLRLRKFGEAETLLKKALAYNFENPTSHFLLGVTYFHQGKPKEAGTALQEGLLIDPFNARARHYLGLLAVRRGDPQEAAREFEEAVAIDPAFADAHFNLAVIYATADQPDMPRAREHYQEALRSGAKPDPTLKRFLDS
jgi:tetratricopeptide (TPR) repeat protein